VWGQTRICLDITQSEYPQVIASAAAFRAWVDAQFAQYPELFPATMAAGYGLHDILPASQKLPDLRLRRIKLHQPTSEGHQVFTVAPAFVLPYMVGYTVEVEKPLLLRKYGVPYWVLVYIFGRDVAYWHRLETRLGRYSLVGTTLQDADLLPADVLADEKHTTWAGAPAYIATTVAQECVLGAELSPTADTPGLTAAYQTFKTEAQQLRPDYQPETVNTDGWAATQAAWQTLFPLTLIVLCFLHAFLKIRQCGKHLGAQFTTLCAAVWDAYHAPDAPTFLDRVATLWTWARTHLPAGPVLTAVRKLCAHAPRFALAYAHSTAYRTSNMLDRAMDGLDRYLYAHRYFHGHLRSAHYLVRAWALLHNFTPYGPRTQARQPYTSPAHRLNQRAYHPNWLHNLLISGSLAGRRANHRIH